MKDFFKAAKIPICSQTFTLTGVFLDSLRETQTNGVNISLIYFQFAIV
jgi:hypothetical protein